MTSTLQTSNALVNDQKCFEDLCRDLSMDHETEVKAWQKFTEVSQRCKLEGEIKHWLCCALYGACRETPTPTVGEPDTIVMGNCVPVNILLRNCNISIFEFTTKIKLWADMANLSEDFVRQVKGLERKFNITLVLFQRYKNIFGQLFVYSQSDRLEKKHIKFTSRTANKCTSTKLYDFGWRLFLCAKNQKPTSTLDLVTSFHLLICCLDLIYHNVLTENRTDLINPKFKGVPEKWNTSEFDVETVKNYCIIDELCQMTDGIEIEAKRIKNDSWCTTIKGLFDANTIHGDCDTFLGIISNLNIDFNLKSLNSTYEHFALSAGEFDERIMPTSVTDTNNGMQQHSSADQIGSELKTLIPNTPYTRQHFLPHEDAAEPLANATNSVKKLRKIANYIRLTDFILNAGDLVVNKITEIIEEMSQMFISKFPNRNEANDRFCMAKSLTYYLLDKIVKAEIAVKPKIDLQKLLTQQGFITTLTACSVELVLEAYNSQLKFPWILDCFNIKAFEFLKILEIIVLRQENILTRALIKHLNSVEETCLESLAWKKGSPVWDLIKRNGKPLPKWSEVSGDNNTEASAVKRISPVVNTAFETFNSTPGPKTPTPQTSSINAKRDLFNKVPDEQQQPTQSQGHKLVGSLPIFLRKLYKLAWLRITNLCKELAIEQQIQERIWTLFERSITHHTELLEDRHLDQILMCAIYIYIKVADVKDKFFTDIMKAYRKQPQATSSVYREVLVSEPHDEKPTFEDIICFYNRIYVPDMKEYSLKFNEKNKLKHDLLLSPHPPERRAILRKVTPSLYVSEMPKNDKHEYPNQIIYSFNESPAKGLQQMNEIVKRPIPLAADGNADIEYKRARMSTTYKKTLQGIIEDRKK